jgi:hypothetical protein
MLILVLEQPHCPVQEQPSPSGTLRSGGREHKEILTLGVARITQLVEDVARGDESIAFPENKDIVPDDERI